LSFEQERGRDLPPSFSKSNPRNQSPQKQQSTRSREFYTPPSPVLAPYCVSMKRGSGSPCSSPALVPVRGVANGRKGRLEH
jgi:hypothetical protein